MVCCLKFVSFHTGLRLYETLILCSNVSADVLLSHKLTRYYFLVLVTYHNTGVVVISQLLEVGEMFEEKLDTFNYGCDAFRDDENQSVVMMNLQPKILQETESSSSMRCLEMILLKRLLSIKELKMKRMKERLEEQQIAINDLNRRIKTLESGWHQNLLTHINVTVNFLHNSVALIFNWVYSLVISAVQVMKLSTANLIKSFRASNYRSIQE